jgi:hypothetical protein
MTSNHLLNNSSMQRIQFETSSKGKEKKEATKESEVTKKTSIAGLNQQDAAATIERRKQQQSRLRKTMKKVGEATSSSKDSNSQQQKTTNEGKKKKGKKGVPQVRRQGTRIRNHTQAKW